MRIDLDEMERTARKATPGPWWLSEYDGSVCAGPEGDCALDVGLIDFNPANTAYLLSAAPPIALALIARIRELETLGNEALNKLATATVALKAEGIIDSTEAAAAVAWIRERHATIAKGTCTP